ncbi:MAG: LPS assembly lipoprotein LptE [Aestuariivirga sp.]|uniref:LPS assembly lipoprotein LptE n=1 Tax=Aestuariivirga sp. TaxID=2650926 RepID=UPI0030180428
MPKLSAILLMVAALVLAGCGYRPMYGSSATSPGVAGSLAAISIPEASDRPGQLIRNELISSMQAGKGTEPKYLLNLTTTVADNGVIQNKQPAVTRQAILITTNFELIDRSTGKVVTKGTTFARVPYDVVRQPFADLQAQKDATERAAREIGADIRTRLAAYFAKQPQSS